LRRLRGCCGSARIRQRRGLVWQHTGRRDRIGWWRHATIVVARQDPCGYSPGAGFPTGIFLKRRGPPICSVTVILPKVGPHAPRNLHRLKRPYRQALALSAEGGRARGSRRGRISYASSNEIRPRVERLTIANTGRGLCARDPATTDRSVKSQQTL
jgi:hypothetical protein